MRVNKEDFLKAVILVKNLSEDDDCVLEFLWGKCDQDDDGFIEVDDFNNICDVLVCNVKENESETTGYAVSSPYDSGWGGGGGGGVGGGDIWAFEAERRRLRLWDRFLVGGLFPKLRVVIVNRLFRHSILFCILASNFVLIFNANKSLVSGEDIEGVGLAVEIMDWGFIIFFLFEMCLKVGAVGLRGYLKTPW